MLRYLRVFGAITAVLALLGAFAIPASADTHWGRSSQPSVTTESTVASATATATAITPNATIHGCEFQWFCAYPGTNFTGTPIKMFDCNVDVFMPFANFGSFVNNQTAGTRATFKDSNHNVINRTLGAYTESASFNWGPVFYVQAC